MNYACALLANAVRTERGAVDFVGRSFPEGAVTMHSSSSSSAKNSHESSGGAGASQCKQDTKPTATLLLSRFLNPAYIETSSPGYKSAMDAWNNPKINANNRGGATGSRRQKNHSSCYDDDPDLDEYDSDFDDKESADDDNEGTPAAVSESSECETAVKDENEGIVEYYDPYQHVAAVIMNITQLERGRDFLMKLTSSSNDKSTAKNATASCHLQSLLPQLTSPNLARRRGIAGTIKNCCFSQDSIWWLLHVVHIDKSILMTLAGPEELTIDEKVGLDPDYWLLGPQKRREPDALVRLYVAEAILLLLSSGGRRARETLRERRTFVIVKLADMVEEDEEVSERLFECVQYLRRDEEGTEEGSSDRRAYEKYARGMVERDGAKNIVEKVSAASSGSIITSTTAAERDDDYDDVD